MPSFAELAGLLGIVAAAAYWMQAMHGKELARAAGKHACQQAGMQFLDDTVVLTKVRLRRDDHGRVVFYREYRFEFTSDGVYRYPGEVILMGERVQQCSLGPYRD